MVGVALFYYFAPLSKIPGYAPVPFDLASFFSDTNGPYSLDICQGQ